MAIDQISSGLIKDNAVTTAKINNDAVTGAKIVAGAVDADIQNNAVTTAKIADDAVTYTKLQNLGTGNRVLGATGAGVIGEVQVATAMVADDAVTSAKLGAGAVDNTALGASAVTGAKIAAGIYLTASATQNITGALPATTNSCYLSQKFVVTGNITISGNMTLTKMSDDGVTTGFILDDGTTRTISGTGILTLGCLI